MLWLTLHKFKSPDRDVRRAAVLKVMDSTDQRVTTALVEALQDRDEEVRRLSARILAQRGDSRAVPVLCEELLDRKYSSHERCKTARIIASFNDVSAPVALLSAVEQWDDLYYTIKDLLYTMGDAAFSPLVQALNNPNFPMRITAIDVLGRLKAVNAVVPLIEAYQRPAPTSPIRANLSGHSADFYQKKCIVKALANIADPRARDILLKELQSSDSSVSDAARRGLEKLGWKPTSINERVRDAIMKRDGKAVVAEGRAATDTLLQLIQPQEHYRVPAIQALGTMRDERAVDPLIQIIVSRDDWACQMSAVAALAQIGDRRAVEPIIERLNQFGHGGSTEGKLSLINALGKLADARALSSLVRWVTDKSKDVAFSVENAIRAILVRDVSNVSADDLLSIVQLNDITYEEDVYVTTRGVNQGDPVGFYTKTVDCTRLRNLAQQIITDQQLEINVMQAWLKRYQANIAHKTR